MTNRIQIVIDEDHDSTVELWMLDDQGQPVEGGTFDLNEFMDHVLSFYNQHF
jgi:poly-beta-hydroxyalkanoate depolymerase